jgi:hypothetical protein
MKYLMFTIGFVIIHAASYTLAGALALKFSKDLYEEKERLLDWIRNMSDESDKKHVEKWFLPAQIIRGIFLSIVLYPILDPLSEISYLLRVMFLGSLMFIYADLASAVPFPHNIEGFVYMKSKYMDILSKGKLYLEMAIYSIVFAVLASRFLF